MKISRVPNIKRAVLFGLLATLGIIVCVRANDPRMILYIRASFATGKMPSQHSKSQTTAQVSRRTVRVPAPPEFAIRRVYGHSIVPGGIHSVEELKRAIVADPLAAQHYSGFDVSKAYVTRLPHDGWYFLSYRLNHRIYFTSALRLIRGGEEVLTDGNAYILTRCGNEIALSPLAPVDVTQEPMDLDIIVAELPSTPAPESGPVSTPFTASPLAPPSSATLPAEGGEVTPPPVFFVPLAEGGPPIAAKPLKGTADDLDIHTEITMLICGLAAILAWRLVAR
jgi:hypothetical protein